jgi:glycosyltransferase involved in cell wall biosynthesis
MPETVNLQPGINVIAHATEVSQAAFGLCPGTFNSSRRQILSASKFYDYLALGLPVVLSDNTPESSFVREFPFLGELYSQGDPDSLKGAIHRVLNNPTPNRAAIQDWVFSRATYKHRAEVLDGLLG